MSRSRRRTTTSTELERKLELLEIRLTGPPATPQSAGGGPHHHTTTSPFHQQATTTILKQTVVHSSPSDASTATLTGSPSTPTQQQQQQQQEETPRTRNNNNSNNNNTMIHSNLPGQSNNNTNSRMSLPPLSSGGSHNNSLLLSTTTTTSQHSFGFDTPSLSGHSSSQQLLTGRSKSAAVRLRRSSLSLVQEATEKHIRKVVDAAAAAAATASHHHHYDSSSNAATRITSHVVHHPTTTTTTMIVQETPPCTTTTTSRTTAAATKRMLDAPAPTTSNATTTMFSTNSSVTAAAEDNSNQTKPDKKRKQAQPKQRLQTSIKENCGVVAGSATTTATSSSHPAATTNTVVTTTTTTTKRTRRDSDAHSPVRNNNNNNSSSTVVRQVFSPRTNNKRMINRTLFDFYPKPTSHAGAVLPTTPGTTTATTTLPPDHHNVVAATAPVVTTSSSTTTTTTNTREATILQPSTTITNDTNNNENRTMTTDKLLVSDENDEYWKQKYQELERVCRDKTEQLAAVSNNRTILHTALQAALKQREQELEMVKRQAAAQQASAVHMVETAVRQEAERAAVELRERLAADGARLGRMVPSRVGMRWQETWQDGHATQQLVTTKAALVQQWAALEQRHAAALAAAERVVQEQQQQQASSSSSSSATTTTTTEEETSSIVGGMVVRTPLDAMEAVESVRFHMSNLKQEEKELAETEKRLNAEKAVHIRALRRVASEDASRFRSRPKLNDRYVLKSLLGKGGFSEVWRAYDLQEFREVAVKIHQLDPRWSDAKKENYTKHVSREYEIHRNVRHARIVSLYDVFEIDNNSFATVLECCSGRDLDILLKEKRRLAERDARAILLQILAGMHYLSHPSPDGSRQGIIHYDLKPGNILFDEHGDAKITDFGLSKILDTVDPADSMELTSQGAGTYWYLPPECFVVDETVRISNKVDVWSIGVIFYQMLFGKRPFGDGQSQDKILADQTMLNAHEVRFPEKIEVSTECKQFIKACLSYDQTFRPTIAQLCEHPYIVQKLVPNDK